MTVETASDRVQRYLDALKPGTVFTPAQLVKASIGTSAAVRQALHRLARRGAVRRLSHGYYDIPKISRVGALSPTRDAIVAAISEKTGATIERSPLAIANELGLTDQVAARPRYRSNLPSKRRITIGRQVIELLPTSPRSMGGDHHIADEIIDAIKLLGRERVTERHIQTLRHIAADGDVRKELKARVKRAPQWIAPIVNRITESGS